MIGHLASPDQKELLKYTKDRVIGFDSDSGGISDTSDLGIGEVRTAMNYSIIQGISFDRKIKREMV